ncbi:hypothetical protein KJ766_01675, partial [Patescibacteria group bacterium]|nr:hypothetical protein [Patescibacteria group bacterium]
MLSKEDYLHRKQMWDSTTSLVRNYFSSLGFIEVQTPLLVAVPDMNPFIDPFELMLKSNTPVEERPVALITSPEYSMKKLLGSGIDKIFTITKVFRNNESLHGLHSPEFTMLEWYGRGDYNDCMSQTGQLINEILKDDSEWPRVPYRFANFDKFGEPNIEERKFFITEYPKEQASLAKLTDDGKFAERFEGY